MTTAKQAQPDLFAPAFGTDSRKLYRRGDPDTSREAAEGVDTNHLEQLVYECIWHFGAHGCISDDVRARWQSLPYSSVTARFSALEKKGLIVCGPDKRQGLSGRSQRVMRASGVKPNADR
jgi:hypothetical protein